MCPLWSGQLKKGLIDQDRTTIPAARTSMPLSAVTACSMLVIADLPLLTGSPRTGFGTGISKPPANYVARSRQSIGPKTLIPLRPPLTPSGKEKGRAAARPLPTAIASTEQEVRLREIGRVQRARRIDELDRQRLPG